MRTRHQLQVVQPSRLSSTLSEGLSVNSYHDFAVRSVAAPLCVVAESEDGCPEAIEHAYKPVFGQMWHPERERPFLSTHLAVVSETLGLRLPA